MFCSTNVFLRSAVQNLTVFINPDLPHVLKFQKCEALNLLHLQVQGFVPRFCKVEKKIFSRGINNDRYHVMVNAQKWKKLLKNAVTLCMQRYASHRIVSIYGSVVRFRHFTSVCYCDTFARSTKCKMSWGLRGLGVPENSLIKWNRVPPIKKSRRHCFARWTEQCT